MWAIKEEIKSINAEYRQMLLTDRQIDEDVAEMTKSEEYQEYQRFMSEDFFNWSEDFFTLGLYEMGTAS
jgi:hypothetical protein